MQRAPRKWEVRAAPPLSSKLAGGEDGMVPGPDEIPSGNAKGMLIKWEVSQPDNEGRLKELFWNPLSTNATIYICVTYMHTMCE